jgi:hypothetical protein
VLKAYLRPCRLNASLAAATIWSQIEESQTDARNLLSHQPPPSWTCSKARRSVSLTSDRTLTKPSASRSWVIASVGAVEFAQGGGELGRGHGFAQGGHLGVGPDIAALVERVPGVALEPAPLDQVHGSRWTTLTSKNTEDAQFRASTEYLLLADLNQCLGAHNQAPAE